MHPVLRRTRGLSKFQTFPRPDHPTPPVASETVAKQTISSGRRQRPQAAEPWIGESNQPCERVAL